MGEGTSADKPKTGGWINQNKWKKGKWRTQSEHDFNNIGEGQAELQLLGIVQNGGQGRIRTRDKKLLVDFKMG